MKAGRPVPGNVLRRSRLRRRVGGPDHAEPCPEPGRIDPDFGWKHHQDGQGRGGDECAARERQKTAA